MNYRKFQVFLFLLAALGCRVIQTGGADLWHGEISWLTRSAGDFSGSPLFCVLLNLWSLPSVDETWLRLLPFLFSLAAALMVYLVARKAFDGNGLLETGVLVAVSPLLCSAAWEVHPCSLELFAAAFWLYAFLRLPADRGWSGTALVALATAVAVTANPLLALLAPAQVVTLLLFRRREKGAALRWAVAFAMGVVVVAAAVLPSWNDEETPAQASARGEQVAGSRRALAGHDVGYLFTDISLGRLFPWAPVTPILTFNPPGFETPEQQSRAIGSPEENTAIWFWQGMQLLLLGLLAATVILAGLAVWRIRTRPLPRYLKEKFIRKLPGDPAREGAALFLLSLLLPVAYCLTVARNMDAPFPERRLLFLAVPFLLLVGRGFVGLQWAATRIILVYFVAILSLAYSIFSSEVKVAATGIDQTARAVCDGWREGDVVVTDAFAASPFRWYSGIDPVDNSRKVAECRRLWVVRFAPPEGSENEGLSLFLAGSGFGRNGDGRERPFLRKNPDAEEVVSKPAGNYSLHLWAAGD